MRLVNVFYWKRFNLQNLSYEMGVDLILTYIYNYVRHIREENIHW